MSRLFHDVIVNLNNDNRLTVVLKHQHTYVFIYTYLILYVLRYFTTKTTIKTCKTQCNVVISQQCIKRINSLAHTYNNIG